MQNSGNTLLEAAEHRSSIVQNNLPAPEKEIIKPKTVEDDIEPKEPEKSEEIEDGSDFSGETHPAMVALKTGETVKDVLMGVFNPDEEDYRWINANAVPEYRGGERKPYQVYT